MAKKDTSTNEFIDEIAYLRFFYDAVQPALGPADDDIIYSIQQDYKKQIGRPIPEDYDLGYEEE